MGSIFCSQVLFHFRPFDVRKGPVVDQNFTDISVEIRIVKTRSDSSCRPHACDRRELSALSERQDTVYLQGVDIALVNGSGDTEITPDLSGGMKEATWMQLGPS